MRVTDYNGLAAIPVALQTDWYYSNNNQFVPKKTSSIDTDTKKY